MIFVLLTLIIFLLGIFLVVKKRRNENQTQNFPPGPWGLPLLGHLVSLGLNPHLTLMKWKQKYGPIISCRFGSFPTVVLGDAKVMKEAFSMAEFAGRPQIQIYMENNFQKGIGMAEGHYNTELRQFTFRKLKEFGAGRKTLEDKIHEGISEFMDFIKMREGLPIKSEDVPSAHIIRTLWSIMMTDKLNTADIEHLTKMLKRLTKLGSPLAELAGFMPWMQNLTRRISFGRVSLYSFRADQLQGLQSFFGKALEEKNRKRTKYPEQALSDIMDFYLEKVKQTTDKSSPFHVSHKSAMHYLVDVASGGIHSIHTTLVWMLFHLAKNPEIQSKLQDGIDEVIGNSRLPSLSDRGQMPYADAVIHELLRISSVFPFGVPHKTTADIRFHGHTIKKDTMVVANIYGVHHDSEVWDQPEIFRPERWFGEQGKKHKSENFFPFTTGRRNCPGEGLARDQLFLYVTTLFQRYNVDFYGKAKDVKAVFGIFLAPSEFTVVFNSRITQKS